MNMDSFGKCVEDFAAKHLATRHGWRLIERNVHFREGEIDLIMAAGSELRFIEVKGRKNTLFGDVVESLTTQKICRLRRAILKWRMRSNDHRFGQMIFLGVFVRGQKVIKIEEHIIE